MAKSTSSTGAISTSQNIAFLGQHLRGVDNGRVIIPPEWRANGSLEHVKVVLWPLLKPEYILVLPPSRWDILQKNLEALPLTDPQAAVVERLIGASTFERTVDKYGRLQLPEEALKLLGSADTAQFVGRMNKFEIWNPKQFAAMLAEQNNPSISEALQSIRI